MRIPRGNALAKVLLLLIAVLLTVCVQPAMADVDETLGKAAPGITPIIAGPPVPYGATAAVVLDDFNRPDGPIGPNWTVHNGYFNVSSNAVVGGGAPGRATFNGAAGDGNVAEADVAVNGTSVQYTGLLLNYGAGVNNLFLKVQQQNGAGTFDHAAFYTGDGNSGSFGPGFFTLSSPFSTAHMKATRVGNEVTLEFTNIDGGAQPPQTYVGSGAPAVEGTGIGIVGYDGYARLDNFAGMEQQSTAIPTMSEWGMFFMTLMLAGTALWIIRRRRIS